jgi:hypothetical protein
VLADARSDAESAILRRFHPPRFDAEVNSQPLGLPHAARVTLCVPKNTSAQTINHLRTLFSLSA